MASGRFFLIAEMNAADMSEDTDSIFAPLLFNLGQNFKDSNPRYKKDSNPRYQEGLEPRYWKDSNLSRSALQTV